MSRVSPVTNQTPSFCYIAPTPYLDYASSSSTHLTLGHLVDQDDTYAEYYRIRGEVHGDFIMMDNSSYEKKEPYSPEKLISLAKKSGASAIVLPDYPFKPWEVTVEAAEKWIPMFKDAGFSTFFVPQSVKDDTEGWIAGYKWACGNPNVDIIGMSILGIPNAITWCDPAFARVVMTAILKDNDLFDSDKHHHYLGLNSGPALEIPSLLRMGVLDTIDSSGPVWSAILGHSYTYDADSYQLVRKLTTPVDFDMKWSKDAVTHDRIRHNIKLTQLMFENYDKQRVWFAEE